MKLAQFKREFENIHSLEMINCSFPNKLLNIKRKVVDSNSVGFRLLTEKADGSMVNSYMDWPKADGFSYDSEKDQFTFTFNYNGKAVDSFVYQIFRKCEMCGETCIKADLKSGVCLYCHKAEVQGGLID